MLHILYLDSLKFMQNRGTCTLRLQEHPAIVLKHDGI